MNNSRIITIANNKGGVSKTTSTISIGAVLNKKGFKVLLIDIDPQANLTAGLGINPLDPENSILELLKGEAEFEATLQDHNGINLIPSNLNLSNAEFGMAGMTAREYLLRKVLKPVRERYDFILIDTPPSLGIFTMNALACSDYMVIPYVPEPYSIQGIHNTYKVLPLLKELNENLSILGILASQVDLRLSIHSEAMKIVKENYNKLVFDSFIRIGAPIKAASGTGKTIIEYEGQSRVAQEYTALTEEILERLNGKG